jgi:hypothetical protein
MRMLTLPPSGAFRDGERRFRSSAGIMCSDDASPLQNMVLLERGFRSILADHMLSATGGRFLASRTTRSSQTLAICFCALMSLLSSLAAGP